MDGLGMEELLETLRDIAQTVFRAKGVCNYECVKGCPYETLCKAAYEFQRDLSCGPRGSRAAYKAIAEMLITTCADETYGWEEDCYDRALSALMDIDCEDIE